MQFAIASDLIRSDMVEITEFPHLAVKYHVQGVPKTMINEEHSFEGVEGEMAVVQKLIAMQ